MTCFTLDLLPTTPTMSDVLIAHKEKQMKDKGERTFKK